MVVRRPPHRIPIPLNRPSLTGSELRYIRDAVHRGQLSGDGFYTRQCSAHLEHLLDVPRVLLTPSCTHALELAFLLLKTEPGQEVLCPSFTFPSTANAFVLRGLKPKFIDVRPDTLNIDERLVSASITKRTVAICPVHYAGVPCQMDVLMGIARRHRVAVVEDAAQALGARFQGKYAGSFGALSAFSFHETKNCNCGEGGALVLNDRRYIRRAEIIRQKGTNREQFFRGEVDKYSWVDVGSSYVPSELQTAYLLAQLESLNTITRRRRRLYENYLARLAPLQAQGALRLPVIPLDCESSYHLFHILLENEKERRRVIKALHKKGIYAAIHYVPLHLSTMGRRFGYGPGDFPVSEEAHRCLLRLPLFHSMTAAQQNKVIAALVELF